MRRYHPVIILLAALVAGPVWGATTVIDCDPATEDCEVEIECDTASAAPAAASGAVWCDSGNSQVLMYRPGGGSDARVVTTGDTDTVDATMLKDTDAPADEECLTYEATGTTMEWQACGAGTGDVTDVGDCATGACFTGASGSQLVLDDAGGDCTIDNAAGIVDVNCAVSATSFTADPSSGPAVTFRDSDMGGTPDTNAAVAANCPTGTTAGGNEDCDLDLQVQAAGALTTVIHIDTTDAGDTSVQLPDTTLYIQEQAEAAADIAGYGQLWVNTATPNELWFTDDAGTDFQLGVGGSAATSKHLLPAGPHANSGATGPAVDDCFCYRWFVPAQITIDAASYVVNTLDATAKAEIGVFSADGTDKHFECTMDVTTTGFKTCAADEAAETVGPGDLLFCYSEGVNNTSVISRGTLIANNVTEIYMDIDVVCTGGEMPDTIGMGGFAYTAGSLPAVFGLRDN